MLEQLESVGWTKVSATEFRKDRMRVRLRYGKLVLEHRWKNEYRKVQVCDPSTLRIEVDGTYFDGVRAEDKNLKLWVPPRNVSDAIERTLVTFNYSQGLEAGINPYTKPWSTLRPKFEGHLVTMRGPKSVIQYLDEKGIDYTSELSSKS